MGKRVNLVSLIGSFVLSVIGKLLGCHFAGLFEEEKRAKSKSVGGSKSVIRRWKFCLWQFSC
jgi:hypothetical protein